jgi:fatty acid-binding protein DegV
VARLTPAAESLDVAIGHAVCPQDAAELERELRCRFDNIHRTTITDIGAALGVHGGPGTLIVATQPYSRPVRD